MYITLMHASFFRQNWCKIVHRDCRREGRMRVIQGILGVIILTISLIASARRRRRRCRVGCGMSM